MPRLAIFPEEREGGESFQVDILIFAKHRLVSFFFKFAFASKISFLFFLAGFKIVDIEQEVVSGVVEPLQRHVVRGSHQVFLSQDFLDEDFLKQIAKGTTDPGY